LIIGGTQFQPIHFDVAETQQNKEKRSEALSSPYAPASVLLSLTNAVTIAVKKERVMDIESHGGETYCSIVDGIVGEKILVVGEHHVEEEKNKIKTTRDIVELESKTGFVIKGDVEHAGTKCFAITSGNKMCAWKKVQSILMPLLFNEKQRNESGYRHIFNDLCEVEALDTITRLHFMIGPKGMPNILFADENVGVDFPGSEKSENEEEDEDKVHSDKKKNNDNDKNVDDDDVDDDDENDDDDHDDDHNDDDDDDDEDFES